MSGLNLSITRPAASLNLRITTQAPGTSGVTQGDIDDSIAAHSADTDPHGDRAWANDTFALLAHNHDSDYSPLGHNHDGTYIPVASKGVANGVADLDENGFVPVAQLPSYVSDIIEADNFADLSNQLILSNKVYVTLDDNKTYRWSGSAFVEISASLAIGTTSATAGRGDHTASAYAHSLITAGNPHGTTAADVGAATSGHNHDGVYQPAGSYATSGHNHDGTYQPYGYGSVGLDIKAGAPVVSGTWTYGTTLNLDWYGTTAQNGYAEWYYVPLGGTYTFNLSGIEAATYGIVTVTIDGLAVGTIDCYAGSSAGKQWSIAGIVVTPGMHTVRLSNPTKNASSSGYTLRLNSAAFNRTT